MNASSVVIVTQHFHLPRAIYTCERLGMRAIGVRLEEETPILRDQANQEIRETLATALVWWETGGQLPAILMMAIAIILSIRYVIGEHRATPI